jgi:hypothetical protein
MTEAAKNHLSPAVAKKYKVTVPQHTFLFLGEEVDLRKINLAKAKELVEKGFEFLKAIDKKEADK